MGIGLGALTLDLSQTASIEEALAAATSVLSGLSACATTGGQPQTDPAYPIASDLKPVRKR